MRTSISTTSLRGPDTLGVFRRQGVRYVAATRQVLRLWHSLQGSASSWWRRVREGGAT
jgi:hypothetical protein